VADDKKKEDSEEGKKKGLPAVVMIAIGAIAGGAGVVFAVPPKTIVKETPPPVFEDVFVESPDITVEFNPRTRAGKGAARVSFKFEYLLVQEQGTHAVEDAAKELVEKNWEKARSMALELFKSQSLQQLNAPNAMVLLKHDLVEGLNNLFFPGDEPVAQITDIYWTGWLMQ